MSNTNRKRFVIVNTQVEDNRPIVLAVRDQCAIKEAGFVEYTAPFTREEVEALPHLRVYDGDAGYFTRRVRARQALAALRTKTHFGRTWGEHLRIVEVGEFKREVKPVKHWNIERTDVTVDRDTGKAIGDTGTTTTWRTGIKLREDARITARDLTKHDAHHVQDYGVRVKYRAVAVYA